MAKYRKIGTDSEIVEAIQRKQGNALELIAFTDQNFGRMVYTHKRYCLGDVEVFEGDYIVKNAKGELSVCKSDVFEATHESVEKTIKNH